MFFRKIFLFLVVVLGLININFMHAGDEDDKGLLSGIQTLETMVAPAAQNSDASEKVGKIFNRRKSCCKVCGKKLIKFLDKNLVVDEYTAERCAILCCLGISICLSCGACD